MNTKKELRNLCVANHAVKIVKDKVLLGCPPNMTQKVTTYAEVRRNAKAKSLRVMSIMTV